MANPATLIVSAQTPIESGSAIPILASTSGVLSTLKGALWTPQNLINCQINPADQSVRKHVSTYALDAGCTSVETITSGEGALMFVANTAPAGPGYPLFGGRIFFGGLTSEASVSNFNDVDYAIEVWEGGVQVYEGGIIKRTARASRNNGVYSVGIENGQIIFRADGEVIYRSATPFAYPLRAAAVFFHGDNLDHIGGVPITPLSYSAISPSGAGAGSFAVIGGTTHWTAPAARGKYMIRVATANNVIGETSVEVLKRLPWGVAHGLPCPTRWMQLPPEWPIKEQVFDDESAEYNLPYDNAVRRWRIEYTTKLNRTQAATLDNFYFEHRGAAHPFYFFDEREGVLYDNVRFVKDRGYTRDHQKIWLQSRTLELIRRPT